MYVISIKLRQRVAITVRYSVARSIDSIRLASQALTRSPLNSKTWSSILSSGTDDLRYARIHNSTDNWIVRTPCSSCYERQTDRQRERKREPSVGRSPITSAIKLLSKISPWGQKWGQRRFTTFIIDRAIRPSVRSLRSSREVLLLVISSFVSCDTNVSSRKKLHRSLKFRVSSIRFDVDKHIQNNTLFYGVYRDFYEPLYTFVYTYRILTHLTMSVISLLRTCITRCFLTVR